MAEVNLQNDFLRREREILRSFREFMDRRTHAEAKAGTWRRDRLKDANDRFKDANDRLTQTRRTGTRELDKARKALKDAQDALSGIGLQNELKQVEPTKVTKPTDLATVDGARELANHSSTAVEAASGIAKSVEQWFNWRWAARERLRLDTSLWLLLISSLGFIFFLFGIIGEAPVLLFLGLVLPPVLLAFADSVWNLGKKEPGEGFSKGYLWLWLVAPVAPFVALYWIFASYSSSLVTIDKRYQPKAPKYKVVQQIQALNPRLVQALAKAELYHNILLEQAQQALEQAQQEHRRNSEQIETDYQQMVSETVSNYEKSWQQVQKQSTALHQTLGLIGAPWDDPLWDSWTPTAEEIVSPYLRVGRLVDQDERNRLAMPALVPVIGKGNIIIKCSGAAKDKAVQIVQNLMLRMLVTVPPGKLRFTLIDPVGLGQSMAAFMSLADYDEALVGGKIWTEPQHIEEQLARLTEHMEFVIQKFLRDKYPTIEDYNTEAGEVAEPYRGLVIVNFPVNFTESAARRLVSIAQNGPRCGVYTIATVDAEQQLPYGFRETEVNQEPRKRRSLARKRRKMYPAICASCWKECQVPFQPTEDRPVYCDECYAEIKEEGNEYYDD